MSDEEGRALLNRHVQAAQAYSEALGRGRVLLPEGDPIAEVWHEYYRTELRRLEEEADRARAAWQDWFRRPR